MFTSFCTFASEMSNAPSEIASAENEPNDIDVLRVGGFTIPARRVFFPSFAAQLSAQNVPSSRPRHVASPVNFNPPLDPSKTPSTFCPSSTNSISPSTYPFTIIQQDRTVSGWQEAVLRTCSTNVDMCANTCVSAGGSANETGL